MLIPARAREHSAPDPQRPLALHRSRSGTLIVADNVVRRGALVEAVAAEPRLMATGLQTVGVKGWDGMVLALVV